MTALISLANLNIGEHLQWEYYYKDESIGMEDGILRNLVCVFGHPQKVQANLFFCKEIFSEIENYGVMFKYDSVESTACFIQTIMMII